MLSDLRSATSMNFTMFFVAIRELLDLTQTSYQTINEAGKRKQSEPKNEIIGNKKGGGDKGKAA